MVFCTNCGSEIDDGSKFCPNCGNSMDDSQPAGGNSQGEYNTAKGLFDDIKKGGLNFKKKMDNYAHGEHKEIEKPEGCLYFMNGLQGTLAIYEEYIEFNFTGNIVKKFQSGFGGVKKVYYNQINSIQKRDATDVINGSIEFELPGMAASSFSQNENLISYLPKYQEEADKIYDYVDKKIRKINQLKTEPTQVVQNEKSSLDKLKEAKELLDMGAITQEEFEEIKAKCLADI